jgi:hypothetical protein
VFQKNLTQKLFHSKINNVNQLFFPIKQKMSIETNIYKSGDNVATQGGMECGSALNTYFPLQIW